MAILREPIGRPERPSRMEQSEHPFKLDDIITNGSSAGKVIGLVRNDPRWKCDGALISNVALNSRFGGNIGMSQVVPNYLASSWKVVRVGEWSPVVGCPGLEETYAWDPDYAHLKRELRKP